MQLLFTIDNKETKMNLLLFVKRIFCLKALGVRHVEEKENVCSFSKQKIMNGACICKCSMHILYVPSRVRRVYLYQNL